MGVQYRSIKPIDVAPNQTCPLILGLHDRGGHGTQNIKSLLIWNEWFAGEDSNMDYITEYASDGCDKTGHPWGWLFR